MEESDFDVLTIGLVQMRLERHLHSNRDKIIRFIREASLRGCRLVVFPESALHSPEDTVNSEIDSAIASVKKAADDYSIYVMFCVPYRLKAGERRLNWLLVVNPDGKVIHSYHKLYDMASLGVYTEVPGLFYIDGIPCNAMICADRWIRAVEELPVMKGSKIMFDCSGNYNDEWIPELGWFWCVPRAIRNGAYAAFINIPKDNPALKGVSLDGGHGHTVVIAPDGSVEVAVAEEADQLVVGALDLSKATRARAVERFNHPIFKPFWHTGVRIMEGESVAVPPVEGYVSPEIPIKIAVAQMACSKNIEDNVARMQRMIETAKSNHADVVAFPELAVTGALDEDIVSSDQAELNGALTQLQGTAKAQQIYVVFGMPHREREKRWNSAFVLGPEGTILTRNDQLAVDHTSVFEAGTSTRSMWFRVKGVPSVVTIGHDAVWSEIAELAALRGAQIHFNICYDRDTTAEGTLRRKQFWANLASFRTFTATVNAATSVEAVKPSADANGGSIIWEDLNRGNRWRNPMSTYWPYQAVPLAEAKTHETIIYGMEIVNERNPHLGFMTYVNPQMRSWYELGARIIDS